MDAFANTLVQNPSGKVVARIEYEHLAHHERNSTIPDNHVPDSLNSFSDIPDDIKEQLSQLVDETVPELDFEVSKVYARQVSQKGHHPTRKLTCYESGVQNECTRNARRVADMYDFKSMIAFKRHITCPSTSLQVFPLHLKRLVYAFFICQAEALSRQRRSFKNILQNEKYDPRRC